MSSIHSEVAWLNVNFKGRMCAYVPPYHIYTCMYVYALKQGHTGLQTTGLKTNSSKGFKKKELDLLLPFFVCALFFGGVAGVG